jgi:hypothetical protein
MLYLQSENIWHILPSNTSNLYHFKRVLYLRILKGRQTAGENEVLPPKSSHTTSFLRWGISLFDDESSYLLTNSNKCSDNCITHYKATKFGSLHGTAK